MRCSPKLLVVAALLLTNGALLATAGGLRAQTLPCEGEWCMDPPPTGHGECSLCIGQGGEAVYCCVLGGTACDNATECP